MAKFTAYVRIDIETGDNDDGTPDIGCYDSVADFVDANVSGFKGYAVPDGVKVAMRTPTKVVKGGEPGWAVD